MTDPTTIIHPFDEDTHVEHVGGGRFIAAYSDRWTGLGGAVNGGYAAAITLRALGDLVSHPDPLVVSSFFLRPGEPGPVEILTDIARSGRRSSTGTARLIQNGHEILRTTATFADLSDATNDAQPLSSPPALPDPDDAIDPIGGMTLMGVTIVDRVEFRYAALPGWWRGHPSGDPRAEFWMRFKDGRDADTMSLPLLVDGAAPVVLDAGAAGSSTVELTTHVRARPAPGWLACRVTTRHLVGGYHDEDFEIWDRTGQLVAQARQLAVVLR